MVKKIFNVPSGSKPLEFGKRGKADFCEIYMEGERSPIPTRVFVLSNVVDDDKDTIDRAWILLCPSLVLAPGTGNMAPLDYLYYLQDMSVFHEFEWDDHILLDAMREVKKYQDKRDEGKLKFQIGGCLPMLPVIYMDHIVIPIGCIVYHTIDYSLPWACFVKELDFTALIAVDTLEDGLGKRPISALSSFGSLLEGIYRKRMGLMLSEASKAGFRSDEAKHECRDVTFALPAAPSPGMCDATTSDSSPEQQTQLDCTTGTANAIVTISSPQQPKQQPKQPDNMEQVTTTTA
ncbi:cytokinin-o-glucosyltransferase 2 [Hordeum vulgare]|nr:cytokinin-o-glucosyltransferase 2 [Hordeum vulgare]